jgi:hypothetical protein
VLTLVGTLFFLQSVISQKMRLFYCEKCLWLGRQGGRRSGLVDGTVWVPRAGRGHLGGEGFFPGGSTAKNSAAVSPGSRFGRLPSGAAVLRRVLRFAWV